MLLDLADPHGAATVRSTGEGRGLDLLCMGEEDLDREDPCMQEFVGMYGEFGMVGVAAALLCYLTVSLSKKADRQQKALDQVQLDLDRQTNAVRNAESIVIKLIDRWDESDSTRDRRHEDVVATITELKADLNYVRGRINGK